MTEQGFWDEIQSGTPSIGVDGLTEHFQYGWVNGYHSSGFIGANGWELTYHVGGNSLVTLEKYWQIAGEGPASAGDLLGMLNDSGYAPVDTTADPSPSGPAGSVADLLGQLGDGTASDQVGSGSGAQASFGFNPIGVANVKAWWLWAAAALIAFSSTKRRKSVF